MGSLNFLISQNDRSRVTRPLLVFVYFIKPHIGRVLAGRPAVLGGMSLLGWEVVERLYAAEVVRDQRVDKEAWS